MLLCRSKAQHSSNDTVVTLPHKSKEHKKKKPAKSTNYVEEMNQSDTECDMFTLSDKHFELYLLDVELNGVPVQMNPDTGAAESLINKWTYDDVSKISSISALQPLHSKLCTYTLV